MDRAVGSLEGDAFGLDPSARFAVSRVGREAEPVMVADGAIREPSRLADQATTARFRPAAEFGTAYPGLLAPISPAYVRAMAQAITPRIAEGFGLGPMQAVHATSNYSLVTLPPEALSVGQRLPHVDDADPLMFAVLHYLCRDAFGGTAFFRHRSTGFETMTPERAPAHRAALERELAEAPPPPAYVCGDTAQYEQTAAVEARFNRLLVYRGRVFHSGLIRPGDRLEADPRRGRLTANIFLVLRPA